MQQLDRLIARIQPADRNWEEKAWERLHSQIRPRGSLGQLETIAARLAGIKRSLTFDFEPEAHFYHGGRPRSRS